MELQKASSEVYKVLQAVKFEFKTYHSQTSNIKKEINDANNSIDLLMTTRTNVMNRKLKIP